MYKSSVCIKYFFIFSVFLLPSTARADFTTKAYTFEGLEGNTTNLGAGEGSLLVELRAVEGDPTKATFRFLRTNGVMSITDVYFEDGSLLGISSISGSSGVSFSQGATPKNLPGAQNAPFGAFKTTKDFSADSNTPQVIPNGVDTSTEYLDITFSLLSGQTINDVVTMIEKGLTTSDPSQFDKDGNITHFGTTLRIGIHVQAFGDGNSASFINGGEDDGTVRNNGNPVPAPAGLVLLLSCAPFAIAGRTLRRKLTSAA